jgi:asparagine synthase (glutamine-hydrolysing)
MTLRRARQFLDGLDRDPARQFVKWTYYLDEDRKQHLLRHDGVEHGSARAAALPSDRIVRRFLAESVLPDPGNRLLHLDLRTFLVDNILEYTDKMSMAVGLEVRVPYLDSRLVEHSFSIPFAGKLRGGTSKAVLKEVCGDLLPPTSAKAPKKGFNAPLGQWMRGPLDRYFDDCMRRDVVQRQGLLSWDYLQRLREEHRTGKRDNSYALFSIIMFDTWYRQYLA